MVDPRRIAQRHMVRTAGEVRFIKDRGNDQGQWAWGDAPPSERELSAEFQFKGGQLKPVVQALRSTLMALGHAQSAYNQFTKLKSAQVSPDGRLGGRGYIQKITDMRRQYMNCSEALSSLSDTLYDEINAPHWNPAEEDLGSREREEVRNIVEDAEEIRSDPKMWAEEEEAELDEENEEADENADDNEIENSVQASLNKTAALLQGAALVHRVASRYETERRAE